MMRLIKSNAGMTLVETMAAVLLFAIVMGSLLNVSVQSMGMGKRAEYAFIAYNLAKNHIETLKSMPYSNLPNASETSTYLDATGAPNDDGPFVRNTVVTTNYTGDANLVEIQVTVNYLWKGALSANSTQLTGVISMFS